MDCPGAGILIVIGMSKSILCVKAQNLISVIAPVIQGTLAAGNIVGE